MRVLDPGHEYELDFLDGESMDAEAMLTFVKREGPKYPGNVGHYPGTNIQEVLRALIDRVMYLDVQEPHFGNVFVVEHLRMSLVILEQRAAYRHNRDFPTVLELAVEKYKTCKKCGHIFCWETCK